VRKIYSVLTLISVGVARFALVAGPAGAATITAPTGNPYAVPGSGGAPQAFTVNASGFAPNTNVYVEQCDGTSPTAPGWSPTINCDNLTSRAPVISSNTGVATFEAADQNHAFKPFKGAGPGELFNCLSLSGPELNNGVDNFRNCKLRVSTNNAAVTGDQVFLNLQLPEGGAPPAVTCALQGSWTSTFGLTHTPAPAKPAPKPNPFSGLGTVGTAAGGTCTQSITTKYPISSGTAKFKGKILRGATCPASLATPLDGPLKVTVKLQGINPKNNKLSTVGTSVISITTLTSNPLPSVVYTLTGPITKGIGAGTTARLNLVLDDNQLTLNTQCDGAGFKTVSFTGSVSPSTIKLG
jgi:hypothetical protein